MLSGNYEKLRKFHDIFTRCICYYNFTILKFDLNEETFLFKYIPINKYILSLFYRAAKFVKLFDVILKIKQIMYQYRKYLLHKLSLNYYSL